MFKDPEVFGQRECNNCTQLREPPRPMGHYIPYIAWHCAVVLDPHVHHADLLGAIARTDIEEYRIINQDEGCAVEPASIMDREISL